MKLNDLYQMQYDLDQHIHSEKDLSRIPATQLTDLKIIAFKVELGELLNEVKSFKFWSNKRPNEKHIILEELVDTIHFLLSIAIDRKYVYIEELSAYELTKLSINELALDLFNNSLDCSSRFARAFMCILAIGEHLGFSEDDIKQAYMKKNEKNHQRQQDNY